MTASRLAPPAARLLAPFAPVAVLLVPPESTPAGRLVLALIAAASILVLGLRRDETPGDADLRSATLLLLPLAVAAVLAAPARARAVDEAVLFGALLLAALVGRCVLAEGRSAQRFIVLLATLGGAASLLAVAQSLWLYPQAARALRAGGGVLDAVTDATLVRLEAGRPAGPFVLPTALAGFLAMSIVATAVLARRQGKSVRALALLSLGVQVAALLLTRSLGGLLAATGAAALLIAGTAGRRGRIALGALLGAAVLVAAGFLVARRAEIGGAPGRDPLTLRSGNWRAAVAIALEHPLLGAGPGGFATAYTAQIRPGMNETRYAHNSWLQIVACWGLWTAAPLVVGAAAFARRAGGRDGVLRATTPERAALAAGGAAFLLHNLLDFTLYQPSVAIPGALLVGSVFAMSTHGGPEAGGAASPIGPGRAPGPWCRRGRAIAALILAGLLLIQGGRAARVAGAMERAQAAALAGRIDLALAEGRRAAAARADDPDPQAFLSELILAQGRDDPALAREGTAAAERAVHLDPRSAVRHATRAAWYAAAGATAPAAFEMARARALYPTKPQYRAPEVER